MAEPSLNGLPYNPIFRRILAIVGSDKQVVIADMLGVSQATVSNMVKQITEKQPLELEQANWVFRFYWKMNINPRWLLYGEGLQKVPTTLLDVISECKTEHLQQELIDRMPDHHLIWVKRNLDATPVIL